MVGNSMKSDILPALEAGAWAIHVPHDLNWALEHAEAPLEHEKFHVLDHIGQVLSLLQQIQDE